MATRTIKVGCCTVEVTELSEVTLYCEHQQSTFELVPTPEQAAELADALVEAFPLAVPDDEEGHVRPSPEIER